MPFRKFICDDFNRNSIKGDIPDMVKCEPVRKFLCCIIIILTINADVPAYLYYEAKT